MKVKMSRERRMFLVSLQRQACSRKINDTDWQKIIGGGKQEVIGNDGRGKRQIV